jgi:hypothetical protein
MTGHVLNSRCPWCKAVNTRATNAVPGETVQPVDGDVAMCFYCGEWSIYDMAARHRQRKPTEDEFIEIGEDPDCQKVRAAWTHMQS